MRIFLAKMTNMGLLIYPLKWLLLCLIALLLCCISYLTVIIIYYLAYYPYARYPGPFWARISPLYALLHAYRGDFHLDVTRCHEKYGMPLVIHEYFWIINLMNLRLRCEVHPQSTDIQHR